MNLNILLAEDQDLIRGALATLLEMDDSINSIIQAKDGQAALQLLESSQPDLVITDVEMPNISGLELCEHISKAMPELPMIILTTYSRAGYIRRAMELGVKGFLLKDASPDELISAIHQVMKGQKVYAPELVLLGMDADSPLSQRESTALKYAYDGMPTKKIAEKMCVAHGTARNYISEAINKTGASNKQEAARIAHQNGWL